MKALHYFQGFDEFACEKSENLQQSALHLQCFCEETARPENRIAYYYEFASTTMGMLISPTFRIEPATISN